MPIFRSSDDINKLTIKDIFDRSKEIPQGKTFDSLSDKEKKRLMNRYRFSGYKPGMYQTISGIGNMH
jgi:hypothetical protein